MDIVWKHQALVGLTVEKDSEFNYPGIEGLRFRAYPSGGKSWRWERMLDGQRHKQPIGKFPRVTIKDAVAQASEFNERVEAGLPPVEPTEPEPTQIERMTVARAWDAYIDDCERRGVRSIITRDQEGKNNIVAVIGDMFVCDVTADDIRKVISAPLERCKIRDRRTTTGGAVTSNRVLSMARTFFRFCIGNAYDDIMRNPAETVRPIQHITGRRKKRTLSLRELALLILAAREMDQERGSTWADILTILVMNGNRKSEVMNARGHEWNASEKVWMIGADRYKTIRDCMLPVGPTTAAIMDRRANGNDFLFPPQSGVRMSVNRSILEVLTEKMERIGGKPIEHWTLHHLRYSFRGGIRRAKIADSELAEKIIHPGRKGNMETHYDFDWQDEMREALAKWDKLVNDEISSVMSGRLAVVA